MSGLCIINDVPFHPSLLPHEGYKKDNFSHSVNFPISGPVNFNRAADNDKGKISVAIPYNPHNTSGSAMVINFKPKFLSTRFPTAKQSQIDAYFSHIDWAIDIGVKELVPIKEILLSDSFIDLLIENEPDPKKPGETKYLVYVDSFSTSIPISSHPLIKDHWHIRRLSMLDVTAGICALSGKESETMVNLWPYGLERPQRMATDCKISSFDKSYTWSQNATNKESAIAPVDFYESDRLLAKTQWFFDYTKPGEPARRIQIDADTHIILFSAGLALFDASDLTASYANNDDADEESDDESDGELVDWAVVESENKRQLTMAYWRSPIDGTEIKPEGDLVYGLTFKFKRGRVCITDAWQGIPQQVEENYQKFINSQKATGDCFFYGQKRDILPIKSLAQVIEPHGVKAQVARIMEKMFRAALYGDKLPLSWLSKVINRFAVDGKLVTEKRVSSQEWKLKLINLILENHNMSDVESGAYQLGKFLAYMIEAQMNAMRKMNPGKEIKENNTMVWQNFSIILQNPSAAIPKMYNRFQSVYAAKVPDYLLQKMKKYNVFCPTSLTTEEQGQLILGIGAGEREIENNKKDFFSKKESNPNISDNSDATQQLNLLGE